VNGQRSLLRTIDDLERTVRAIAFHFNADEVFIIGSQSILLSWPEAPVLMRTSGEIDAYPGNAKLWEISHQGQPASEEIHGHFGWGSQFHNTHGFYVDGVDDHTARLPGDWRDRAIERPVELISGRRVLAIAPCPEDIIVSKLVRLEPKDKDFIAAFHKARPLNLKLIEERLGMTGLDRGRSTLATSFLSTLSET
jgi:hypothetical protein